MGILRIGDFRMISFNPMPAPPQKNLRFIIGGVHKSGGAHATGGIYPGPQEDENGGGMMGERRRGLIRSNTLLMPFAAVGRGSALDGRTGGNEKLTPEPKKNWDR